MKKNIKNYNFTLVISGVNSETSELEDVLFDAGCDDAIIYFKNGVTYLEFDRTSDCLNNALISAIAQIESTGIGATVVRIEPDDIVTASEIARRVDLTREAIRKMIDTNSGSIDFPPPILVLNERSTLWSWHAISNWMFRHNKILDHKLVEDACVISNLNKILDLRNSGFEPNHSLSGLCNYDMLNIRTLSQSNSMIREPIKVPIITLKLKQNSLFKGSFTNMNIKEARSIPKWV